MSNDNYKSSGDPRVLTDKHQRHLAEMVLKTPKEIHKITGLPGMDREEAEKRVK